ncbi:MAG: hypothetical protein ABFC30_00490 [Proteiniphilum sp.]
MRGISGKEHERFVKALEYLQEQLKKTAHADLAQKIALTTQELNNLYREYTDAISKTENVVEKYYETFRSSHEEYIHASRLKQKAITLERKNKTEIA